MSRRHQQPYTEMRELENGDRDGASAIDYSNWVFLVDGLVLRVKALTHLSSLHRKITATHSKKGLKNLGVV